MAASARCFLALAVWVWLLPTTGSSTGVLASDWDSQTVTAAYTAVPVVQRDQESLQVRHHTSLSQSPVRHRIADQFGTRLRWLGIQRDNGRAGTCGTLAWLKTVASKKNFIILADQLIDNSSGRTYVRDLPLREQRLQTREMRSDHMESKAAPL